MKRFLWLCLMLCTACVLTAQSSIFDELARKGPKYGTVTIHQSSAIRKLVGSSSASAKKGADEAESGDTKSSKSSKDAKDAKDTKDSKDATQDAPAAKEKTEPENDEITDMDNPEGRVYRVQVYSGNNQRQSKQEVRTMEAQIKRAFPKVGVEPDYQAPFWKLYVGYFQTKEEAIYMLERLRKQFPSYHGMKIVQGYKPKSSSNSNKNSDK
ncbi:hypothetical protein BHU09_02810 [Tannerella sp. oral taxon 808]|nr:hypothetical protein BHU09_02810 [Tannerella sp. oral taxon 808]